MYQRGLVGFGQTPEQTALAQYVDMDEQGVQKYKPEIAKLLWQKLSAYRAVALSDIQVQLQLFTEVEKSAAATNPNVAKIMELTSALKWAKDKLAAGNVIFASIPLLVPAGVDPMLMAIPKENANAIFTTAHVMPILAEPKGFFASLFDSPLKIGLAVGAVALISLAVTKKRRGGSASLV